MKYILSEEEFTALKDRHLKKIATLQEVINELCMEVALYKPTFKGWDGQDDPIPWGCIHNKDKNSPGSYGYCDECSVQKVCMMPQEYSK